MPAVDLAVICVAGIGSRLGLNIPKGLVNLSGKTLIERQLELLTDVPQIRIVIGYKEEEVVEHVRRIRDDVIFVRNRDYAHTSLLQSLYLAVRHWEGPFLALEGDVLFEPTAFAQFMKRCRDEKPGFLGITPSTTDDALYVEVKNTTNNSLSVTGFQRTPKTDYEWSGLGLLDASWIENRNTFAYEMLVSQLPVRAMAIPAFEVDTPADMGRAQQVLRSGNWTVTSTEESTRPVPDATKRFGATPESTKV